MKVFLALFIVAVTVVQVVTDNLVSQAQFLKIMFGGIRNNGWDTESVENNRATLSCKKDFVTIQAVSVL